MRLQLEQEFSIEIPDKEADAIHSGMRSWRMCRTIGVVLIESSEPSRRIHHEAARWYVRSLYPLAAVTNDIQLTRYINWRSMDKRGGSRTYHGGGA